MGDALKESYNKGTTMIKKLKYGGRNIYENTAIAKINELVDAVNEQQQQLNNHMCRLLALENHEEEPADTYAEQRKWIGKLCYFWNNDNEPDTCFGILTGIFDEADRPFERSIGQQLYRYCEPVKPDDDIIYKGE